MKKECVIFWFRRDLRLEDNTALFFALKSDFPVLPIFIFDKTILNALNDKRDSRISFIHSALRQIKTELNHIGSDILIKHDTCEVVWKNLLKEYNIKTVYANEDYEPQARKRDELIKNILDKNKIEFKLYKDQCIFSKDEILKKDGTPYTVYTPYKNRWYETLAPKDIFSYSIKHLKKKFIKIEPSFFPELSDIGFLPCNIIIQVNTIKTNIIKEYEEKRNFPELNATSRLGVHLRFGTVSIRKCVQVGYELNKTWLDELIWREFFMQILYHFPHVEDSSFKKQYSKIPWLNNEEDFQKWCEGKTGYPLVDAGMRELNETGFMHNRVRMVTASFLVKHLLIDWQWGQKYFAEKLLDYDLSANNGNWQWVAGTGCDAAPYFRIFNPEIQLKKFDKNLNYVKKWVPEYNTDEYPKKIIEHKLAYARALLTYKLALTKN